MDSLAAACPVPTDHKAQIISPPALIGPSLHIKISKMEGELRLRTTLKDIANELNLSVNTVSRGLRNMQDISPSTRQVIHETAQRLGYQRNLAASQLRTNRSYVLGIAVPDYINPTMGKTIDGAEFVARMHGYTLMTGSTRESPEIEDQAVSRLLEQGVDGLILVPTLLNPGLLKKIESTQTPYVLAFRKYVGYPSNSICCDDRLSGQLAAQALYDHGHRSFLYVASTRAQQISMERFNGFSQRLAELGIPPDQIHVIVSNGSRRDAQNAVSLWVEQFSPGQKFPATAIFAFSDYTAFGVYTALREKGVRIPEDISVMGCDNNEFANIIGPSMCTIDNHILDISKGAAQMLIDIIQSCGEAADGGPQEVVLKPELVWRQSVACIGPETP